MIISNMDNLNQSHQVRLYKYRWIILILFSLCSFISYIQFLQYSMVTNLITSYYNVSNTLVDLSGVIFMISYILFFIPFNYILDKYNLKIAVLISILLTTIGNLIKLTSVSPERFYLVIVGQFFCGLGQIIIVNYPTKVANLWFGDNEVSTACAISIMGSQLGVAVGSVLPSICLNEHSNNEEISKGLMIMLEINAGLSVALCLTVILFFKARPDISPSRNQLMKLQSPKVEISVWGAMKELGKNRNMVVTFIVFGIANGLWSSFGILSNQVYLNYFPGAESDIGIIALITLISGGCIATLILGFILDKTHKYKLTAFIALFLCGLTLIFVIINLELKLKLWTYFTYPLFGFFMSSVILIAYEFVTEISYPLSEEIACSIYNAAYSLFTIITTLILQEMFNDIGSLFTAIFVVVALFILAFSTVFIKIVLNRRLANVSSPTNDE